MSGNDINKENYMGVSYYVYIGPYIQAPNPEKVHPHEFHSCSNKACRNHTREMSSKFCDKCGTPIALLTVQSTKRIDFDVWEQCGDRLEDVYVSYLPPDKRDFAIFLPNQGKFGNRLEAHDSTVLELNETIMIDEVNRFEVYFQKDIARIAEVFGKSEVKWGVVAYES